MGMETTGKAMQIEKELQNIQDNLRRIHAAYDDKGEDLSAWLIGEQYDSQASNNY